MTPHTIENPFIQFNGNSGYSRHGDTASLFADRIDNLNSAGITSSSLSDRIWSGEGATSYFDGLLPDDLAVREKIAAREQAESAGIFDLLAVIGRDCVGALRSRGP